MEFAAELGMSGRDALLVMISAAGIYAAVVVLSRVFGQRSFSQASSFDLALVVGLGALIGRVVLVRTSLAAGVLGLLTMFTLHAIMNRSHHRSRLFHELVENPPILLVADGAFLDDNVRYAHSSRAEIYAQVRLNGHGSLQTVRSVILEANGKMSVVAADAPLEWPAFADVRGADRIAQWAPVEQGSGRATRG